MDGRILVIGGGIAGLAVAQALRQRDLVATVVDRLAGPPDAGLALNLPGNAVRALGALGLADDLARLGAPVRRREYRNARGRVLFAVDEDEFWGEDSRSRCVRRRDLLDLLGRGLPADTVRWDTPVASIRQTPAGVEVEGESYAFAVGADGVRSAVRPAVVGEAELRTSLLSTASWRFMAPNPGVDCWTVWSSAAGAFLLIPVDAKEVYGYASALRGGTVSADPEWLRTTFARFPDPVPQVVDAVLTEQSSLYHSPVEEVRVDRWTNGRLVLIGDAAHATAPVWAQGAALAVEDALVLAELLATHDDWSRVGPEYERRRRPRVDHVQAMTDRLSKTASMPAWIRDTILPFVGPRTYRETYGPLRSPP
ncbi:FAD-dependent monooxygenase [Phytohabitans rumicis]|uniref:FAD-dependent monooxygenase n=1 Tax=Phytohabitans rumicis TaxID=1076125 RepID=UPI0031EA89DD